MPVVYLADMLRHARAAGSAIPGVKIDSVQDALAALSTAEELLAPLILTAGPRSFAGVGTDAAMLAIEHAAERSGVPVVLHATSIDSEQSLTAAIRNGFCAVTFTAAAAPEERSDLMEIANACGVTVATADQLISSGVGWFGGETAEGLAEFTRELRAAGRSPKFAAECRAWAPVEHVVEFNARDLSEAQIADLLQLGTRQLAAVPGVKWVRTGEAAASNGRYRYCWLIRFANPDVIDSFNKHPLHVAFADDHFRPAAEDRLTTNYVLHAIDASQTIGNAS